VRAAPAALAALAGLLSAAPARGEEWLLDATLLLHARLTRLGNQPRSDVRLSPETLRFDVADYLRPVDDAGYPSAFATAAVEGRRGRWRFQLAGDTGEVRRAPAPGSIAVCVLPAVEVFARADSLACRLAGQGAVLELPSSADGPRRLTLGGRTAADEVRRTWLLREAWVGARLGENEFAFLRAGRHRFTVGEGYVYDDFGLGLEARLDLGALGPSWDLGAALFWPTRDWPAGAALRSPMLLLRADWLPSLFEHVGAFVALARDAAGDVPALFQGAEIEASAVRLQGIDPGGATAGIYRAQARALADALSGPATGTATLVWSGLSGSLSPWRGHRLSFLGAISAGRIHIARPEEVRSTVLGTLATGAWEVRVHPDWLLGARLLWMSGDVPPPERTRLGLPPRYGGFVGLAPWVTATNLFFRGGLSETFAARQASAPGVNGRGVYGPIVRAAWDPAPSLRAEAKAAFLAAPEVGPYGGRVYGPEVDLHLRWSPHPQLALTGEADALWPGSFYGGHRPVSKLIAGLELFTP